MVTERATISQVAAQAGVSTATVSCVLNGKGRFGEETTARVRSAAHRLGYRPNVQARALRVAGGTQRTGNVAILWPETPAAWQSAHHAAQLNRGIVRRLESAGLHAMMSYGSEDELLTPALMAKVDGVVLAGSPHPEALARIPAGYPVVRLASLPDGCPIPRVGLSNAQLGRLAADKLFEAGHRRIALVAHSAEHEDMRARFDAASARLRELGVPPQGILRCVGELPAQLLQGLPRDLTPALLPLLDLPPGERPTAIFAGNDVLAASVYRFAAAQGLRIPGDWSVLGCDDDPGIAQMLHPALTTLRVDFEAVGEQAAAWLLQALDGHPPPPGTALLLPGEWVARESVQPRCPGGRGTSIDRDAVAAAAL
jgi:LacI family transcriptional regulator